MSQRISRFACSAALASAYLTSVCCYSNAAMAAVTEVEGQFIDQTGTLAPTPQPSSVTPSSVALPAETPTYFRRIFNLFLSAPLPGKIYRQGGIPATVPTLEVDNNPFGKGGTYQPRGPTRTADNAFFQSLGTNGRSCVTCHQPPSGMSVSLRNIKARRSAAGGRDPIFAPVDGANCPNLVSASETSGSLFGGRIGRGNRAFNEAHSLLLQKGLFRIFLPVDVKGGGEIEVRVVSDPTTCNLDPDYNKDNTGKQVISMFRRPAISANLNFKTSGNIMWDGREPTLFTQAVSATLGHAQATNPPTQEQLAQIVSFETGVFSAQIRDKQAGQLTADGATGGPIALSADPPGQANSPVFNEYDTWNVPNETSKRQSIARGEVLFNTKTFIINNVRGVSDALGNNIPGQCASCHNVKHAGVNIAQRGQIDIGIGGHAANFQPARDLPIFEVRCKTGPIPFNNGSDTLRTNDPGLAVISGRCKDIGASTVPALRALASHEPYFRDGSAAALKNVVEFYDRRFSIGLTRREEQDLVNFLAAL